MLDHFEVGSPPSHHVIVTDFLIPLDNIDWLKLISPKEVCKQLIEGLAFLHSIGVTHGG